MQTKIKNQSHPVDPRQSMHVLRSVGFKAALAMLAITVGFAAPTTTLRAGPELRQLTIDRTLKGDRMAPAFSSHSKPSPEIKTYRRPAINFELADGCEALMSPLANAALARLPGRCVS